MEECNKETSSSIQPLKIYILPFPTPGHMNPMVNLAHVFATRGEDVTILTTPSNAKQLLLPKHLKIHILEFPSEQFGLPPGLENFSSVKDTETARKFINVMNLVIKSQIETFIQQNPPHVLVHDIMFTWISSSHPPLLIPTIPFSPMPIFANCIFEAIHNNPDMLLSMTSNSSLVIGDLPHSITLTINPSQNFDRAACYFLQAKNNAKHGIIVNSFAELEPGYAEHYEKLTGVKVWHLGITSLMLEHRNETKKNKECGDDDDNNECLSWLNSREPNSVVYICFGSVCRLNKEQYLEMARGIEASEHRFLWVVPKDDAELCCLQEGFDGEKRGMVVKGWVPQTLILKHPSIGGFFTHCGWTSVGEGISAGVPMITMPRFLEQFFNERLLTEVHGIGVEVGSWEWNFSPFEVKKKVVSSELIEKAVRKVMAGNDSVLLRKRAKEMEEKAYKAVQHGGSSYNSLSALIQSLK